MERCSVYGCPSQHSSLDIADFQKVYSDALKRRQYKRVLHDDEIPIRKSLIPWLSLLLFCLFLDFVFSPVFSSVSLPVPLPVEESEETVLASEEFPRAAQRLVVEFRRGYVIFTDGHELYAKTYDRLSSEEWLSVIASNPPSYVIDGFVGQCGIQ